jgi:protocatechuate 3,4-dioxygenase beta subunit
MERTKIARREFLTASSLALAFPLVFGCRTDTVAQASDGKLLAALKANSISDPNCSWCGARDVPGDVSWRTRLAPTNDKGDRILISGTVYKADGKTFAPATLIYLYHTDVHGIYGRGSEHRHGRYRGWMLTDERGRYEFESILPASYPNSTIAKHIHMTVTSRELREDWVDSILFEGDRFLTTRERIPQRGGFNHVLTMEKGPDGMLRGVRNIQLSA